MRRLILGLLLATLAAGPAVAASAASSDAELEHFACQHASVDLSRSISVTAVMRARPGLPKLQLEFELQRRTRATHRFVDLRGTGLGEWISPSDPTLGERPDDIWKLNKPVVNLVAPAVYRFVVHFRWSASGQPPVDETLSSPRCHQAR